MLQLAATCMLFDAPLLSMRWMVQAGPRMSPQTQGQAGCGSHPRLHTAAHLCRLALLARLLEGVAGAGVVRLGPLVRHQRKRPLGGRLRWAAGGGRRRGWGSWGSSCRSRRGGAGMVAGQAPCHGGAIRHLRVVGGGAALQLALCLAAARLLHGLHERGRGLQQRAVAGGQAAATARAAGRAGFCFGAGMLHCSARPAAERGRGGGARRVAAARQAGRAAAGRQAALAGGGWQAAAAGRALQAGRGGEIDQTFGHQAIRLQCSAPPSTTPPSTSLYLPRTWACCLPMHCLQWLQRRARVPLAAAPPTAAPPGLVAGGGGLSEVRPSLVLLALLPSG